MSLKRILSLRKILAIFAVLIVLLVGYAWIGGGEVPLRPIAQSVTTPALMPEPAR